MTNNHDELLKTINDKFSQYGIEASLNKGLISSTIEINDNGEKIGEYKISPLKTLPPTGMCHSAISFITIDPNRQPEEWASLFVSNIIKERNTPPRKLKF